MSHKFCVYFSVVIVYAFAACYAKSFVDNWRLGGVVEYASDDNCMRRMVTIAHSQCHSSGRRRQEWFNRGSKLRNTSCVCVCVVFFFRQSFFFNSKLIATVEFLCQIKKKILPQKTNITHNHFLLSLFVFSECFSNVYIILLPNSFFSEIVWYFELLYLYHSSKEYKY